MCASEKEALLPNSWTTKMSTSQYKSLDVCLTLPVEDIQGEIILHSGRQNEQDELSQPGVGHNDPVAANNVGLIQNLLRKTFCSGKIILFFATIFGLWPVKRKLQILIVTVFTVINIFAFVYVVQREPVNKRNGFNLTDYNFSETFSNLNILWFVLIPSTCLLSYLLMLHYIVFGSRKEYVFALYTAYLKTSDMEWLTINIQFVVGYCILAAYFIKSYIDFCTGCTVLEHILQISLFISVTGMVLTCLVFEVLMCALHKSASECKSAICNLPEGSLDDVIDIHQDLCDHVFTTCQALQFWFVAILVLLGLESVVTITIALAFRCYIKNNPFLSFPIILLSYLFVVLCLYASRLTRKCQSIIREISNSRPQDWKIAHPFHKRKTLNHFIFYANGVNCGFRVFNVTIGDKFGWLSIIVSIATVGIRFVVINC